MIKMDTTLNFGVRVPIIIDQFELYGHVGALHKPTVQNINKTYA